MSYLRVTFVLAAVIPAFGQGQAPAPCLDRPAAERSYSRVRLLDIVRDQTPVRAEYLIRTCGVRAPFTPELLADLKEAKAAEKVIAAVRAVAPRPAGEVRENPRDGLKYVSVPAGQFEMGCATEEDSPCVLQEKPAHEVEISRSFWMGQTEVTTGAYKRFAQGTGRAMPAEPRAAMKNLNEGWGQELLPMTMVDWEDARAYCEWAGMRLPSEAEWEYAARAGTKGARYRPLDEAAWYAHNSGDRLIDAATIIKEDRAHYLPRLVANGARPRPVGTRAPNPWGLYDMLGNVWEWTGDWFQDRYVGGPAAVDPQGPPVGEMRVFRGGAWLGTLPSLRASARGRNKPTLRNFDLGFRCAGELGGR